MVANAQAWVNPGNFLTSFSRANPPWQGTKRLAQLWNQMTPADRQTFCNLLNLVHSHAYDWYFTDTDRGDIRAGNRPRENENASRTRVRIKLRRDHFFIRDCSRNEEIKIPGDANIINLWQQNFPAGNDQCPPADLPHIGLSPSDYNHNGGPNAAPQRPEGAAAADDLARALQANNLILYGPPGTGKTFATTHLALRILGKIPADEIRDSEFVSAQPKDKDQWKRWIDDFEGERKSGRVEFTTFHQTYSYEDFIEGIRASADVRVVSYEVKDGIFKRIAYRALYHFIFGKLFPSKQEDESQAINAIRKWIKGEPDGDGQVLKVNKNPPAYVLIIDEINRGNMARIMGELITLIEDSKRARHPEELRLGHQPLKAVLPLSGDPFIVPPNLYIIGTMNTADRSLVGLDLALRRRFSFIHLPPRPELLKDKTIPSEQGDNEEISLRALLESINSRIEQQLDSDHLIGHAFLTSVNDMEDLASVMGQKILPLLMEYFHDAPERLKSVLPNKTNAGVYFIEFTEAGQDLRVKGMCWDDLHEREGYLAWINPKP